jgi:hypothetical protein
MPCPFTGLKMFWAGPNFWSLPKTAFSSFSKKIVLAQKPILRNANHLFVLHKMFGTGTIYNRFLVRHKKRGSTQNILGPAKEQGIILLPRFTLGFSDLNFSNIFTFIRMYHERKDLSFLNCAYYLNCWWTVLCSGTFINCFRCSFFEEFLEKWRNYC